MLRKKVSFKIVSSWPIFLSCRKRLRKRLRSRPSLFRRGFRLSWWSWRIICRSFSNLMILRNVRSLSTSSNISTGPWSTRRKSKRRWPKAVDNIFYRSKNKSLLPFLPFLLIIQSDRTDTDRSHRARNAKLDYSVHIYRPFYTDCRRKNYPHTEDRAGTPGSTDCGLLGIALEDFLICFMECWISRGSRLAFRCSGRQFRVRFSSLGLRCSEEPSWPCTAHIAQYCPPNLHQWKQYSFYSNRPS